MNTPTRALVLRQVIYLLLAIANAPNLASAIEFVELMDLQGQSVTVSEAAPTHLKVIVFLGTECPLAKLYAGRLGELAHAFPQVGFLGVNSNCQDSLEEIAAYQRRHAAKLPMFKDVHHKLADALAARRTPEAFVLDGDWKVRYRGRIDDQYGVGYLREAPTSEDLKRALTELIADQEVSQPQVDAVGCVIGRAPVPRKDAEITYCNQVAKILQRHCVECHREGEIGPFSLTDYEEVVGWAATIEEVIQDGRMPPWHANPAHGSFKNERLMADDEKQVVYDWVANGAPEGDPADLPRPMQYVSGWQLPSPPEAVISMRQRQYEIPSQGIVEYQYFVVDPGFTEDKWVQAAEVIPGNREVVHHCIVFVRPPDSSSIRGFGWIAAYVPGQMPLILPPGYARRVPAGSKFVFQMHYTPNGSPQTDRTKVGMVFADPDSVQREVITLAALNRRFEIPPGDPAYRVETSMDWLPKAGEIVAMGPHMHLRGKTFQFIAEGPGGEEILLDVPNYDFNWQHVYQLSQPRDLADLRRVRCVATFDNSDGNLVNPNPGAHVTWGDQTYEEMMVGFIDIAIDKDADVRLPWEEEDEDQNERQRRESAQRFVRRYDQDGDGQVSRKEVATSFAIFAFRRLDANEDDVITLEEAVAAAQD